MAKSVTHERPVPIASRIAGYDKSHKTVITDDEGDQYEGVGHTAEEAEEAASERYQNDDE